MIVILTLFYSLPNFLLLPAALGSAGYLSLLSGPIHEASDRPQYDLIFGVHTFNPIHKRAWIGPYIIDGTLYIEAEKLPAE